VLLLVFAIASDLMAASIRSSKLKVSGSFLALVVAMVLLGGPPAALIGAITIVAGWIKWREAPHYLLANLASYVAFPLVCGLGFDYIRDANGVTPGNTAFPILVFATFVVALSINFLLAAGYTRHMDGSPVVATARRALVPLLTSDLVAALMAVGVSEVTLNWGSGALAMFGILLLAFQHLLAALLTSEDRAEDLQRRTEQLASLQVGLLSAMLRTLDLRDRMTARHSAAVARYAREIAKAAGMSEAEQELAHTAGLLHDIGKFVLPDRILHAEVLSDDDWAVIRRHPQDGATIVGRLDGYGPVADAILYHHERIDGSGYPAGLIGNEIPLPSRILSICSVYDTLTARGSYRSPMTPQDAITEMRRVAGTHLDAELVESFIAMLQRVGPATLAQGEAADFAAELAFEKRVRSMAQPKAGV
jgi:putative nucleotidyltransferase with HDIG domain